MAVTRSTRVPADFNASIESRMAKATPSSTACVRTAAAFMAETNECATNLGIIMRRALPGEIRQEGDARRCIQHLTHFRNQIAGGMFRSPWHASSARRSQTG